MKNNKNKECSNIIDNVGKIMAFGVRPSSLHYSDKTFVIGVPIANSILLDI